MIEEKAITFDLIFDSFEKKAMDVIHERIRAINAMTVI